MGDIKTLQSEIDEWQRREFEHDDDISPLVACLVLAEEAGEVARCAAKAAQGIRGGKDHWKAQIASEAADVIISTLSVMSKFGVDAEAAVRDKWAIVGARRYKTAPEGQHDRLVANG